MKRRLALLLLAAIGVLALIPATLHAEDEPERTPTLQAMIGTLDTADAWTIYDDVTGEPLKGGMGNSFYGGGAGQMNFGNGVFEYGFEGGGLVSFKNSSATFYGSSNGGFEGTVTFRNELFLFDVNLGGYVALRPTSWLRLYGAVGPAITWGSVANDQDDVVVEPLSGTFVYQSGGRNHDIQLGYFGRTGIEFLFPNGYSVGASVRYLSTELDFGKGGVLALDKPQFFLTIGMDY